NSHTSYRTFFDSKQLGISSQSLGLENHIAQTTGSPISILIENHALTSNWENEYVARPNHADFTTCKKHHLNSCELVAEGTSARSTALLVAAGSIAVQFLSSLDIYILPFTNSIAGIELCDYDNTNFLNYSPEDLIADFATIHDSQLATFNSEFEQAIATEIDNAQENGDTLGGTIKLVTFGLPVGLGSSYEKDKNLKSQIATGLLSIPSVNGIEFGSGFEGSALTGLQYADEFSFQDADEYDIYSAANDYYQFTPRKFLRLSNNCGGIEGGISNSMPLELMLSVKPIPTVDTPLNSINIATNSSALSSSPRHDTCIVPSMCYIAKAQLAITLASAIQNKFGQDSFEDILQAMQQYNKSILDIKE
ncbi:MAG: chorismate synthase, partial [Coriobacteriales bacterium]|nr:chorismate synthase [Coriobacteriales bacterium]